MTDHLEQAHRLVAGFLEMQIMPTAYLDAMAFFVRTVKTLVGRAVGGGVAEPERSTMPDRMAPPRFARQRGRFPAEHPVPADTHQHITTDIGALRPELLTA